LTRGTTPGARRRARTAHAGAVAAVTVGQAAAAGRRAGWCAADAVHTSERATIAGPRAGLLVGGAADGVETGESAAAPRIDPAEKGATVGVEATAGAVAVAEGERRAGPGGAEAGTALGGVPTRVAVGDAGGHRTRAGRGQLDVTPAAEGRARDQARDERSDLSPGPRRQGCAPVPANRRAVATRRPLGNVAR
jgi:hypothetical protein